MNTQQETLAEEVKDEFQSLELSASNPPLEDLQTMESTASAHPSPISDVAPVLWSS